jgi:uncharacterized tellurite resistance protein B-like protein
MTLINRVKSKFLSFFRDIFVYHNSSLEFRAKLLAAMIGANKQIDECEDKILEKVAKEIYPDNEVRVEVLIRAVNEYVNKIIDNNGLELNELIKAINSELKNEKRFHKKIDINILGRFLECSENDEEIQLIQIRILEFLQTSIDDFNKIR